MINGRGAKCWPMEGAGSSNLEDICPNQSARTFAVPMAAGGLTTGQTSQWLVATSRPVGC